MNSIQNKHSGEKIDLPGNNLDQIMRDVRELGFLKIFIPFLITENYETKPGNFSA